MLESARGDLAALPPSPQKSGLEDITRFLGGLLANCRR
jgi:hypothetical protein